MRPEEVAREQDAILLQVGAHGFRPVNPRDIEELQCFAPERQRLAFRDREELAFIDVQEVDEHGFAFGVGNDLGARIAGEHVRDRAGMILLGVVRNDVVDAVHAGGGEAVHENAGLRRVHGIEQGDLLAALDQVGIVRGPLGQRDQLIEEPPIPVDGTDRIDVWPQFLHLAHSLYRSFLAAASAAS